MGALQVGTAVLLPGALCLGPLLLSLAGDLSLKLEAALSHEDGRNKGPSQRGSGTGSLPSGQADRKPLLKCSTPTEPHPAPAFPGPQRLLPSQGQLQLAFLPETSLFLPAPLPAVSRRCQRQLLSQPSPSWVEAGADRSPWGQPPWGSWSWPSPEKMGGASCPDLGHCGSWVRAGQGLGRGRNGKSKPSPACGVAPGAQGEPCAGA